MHRNPLPARPRAQGFTILEMSVVLVVIALIIGAVSVGRDVYRSAMAERIGSEFVQGWMIAYDRYVQQSGTVPGDDPANPSGRVNQALETPLCRNDLREAMLQRGITLPQGRAEGMETRYVYQDSRGNPQELEICFVNIGNWAEPSTGSNYVGRARNVMRLSGLTPELANQLDTRIDGRVDARFGRMRELNRHSDTGAINPANPAANPWGWNDTHTFGTPVNAPDGTDPDAQVVVMTAYLRMNQ